MIRVFAASVLMGLAVGCRPAGSTFEARWTGADSGGMTGRSTATWCAPERRLEIQGLHGDSGIMLVAYPADTAWSGRYPVFRAGVDSVTRPAAAAAARWFGLSEIVGYGSTGGWVELERGADGRLSGSFEVDLARQGLAAPLRLEGRLASVPVVPAHFDCRVAGDSAPAGPAGDTVLP